MYASHVQVDAAAAQTTFTVRLVGRIIIGDQRVSMIVQAAMILVIKTKAVRLDVMVGITVRMISVVIDTDAYVVLRPANSV